MQVLVIGGANLDIKAKTLGPHVAATSNPAHVITKPGGVGRNIAHNLARLGVANDLVAALGQGPEAELILQETAAAGVGLSHIIRAALPTGTYLAVLDDQGELVTAVNDMQILAALTPAVINNLSELIKASSLVVADCNLSLEALDALAQLCAEKLVIEPVSVVKSKKLLMLLARHSIFLATPNLDQLQSLTGKRDIAQGAAKLHALGLKTLVLHAGAAGAYVSEGGPLTHMPSQASIITDVTGAGDAATAGLVAGLTQNLPLAKAAERGQEAAAKVIASESSTLA